MEEGARRLGLIREQAFLFEKIWQQKLLHKCVILLVCVLIFVKIIKSDRRRDTARAENAQGTPTQSHVSPIILVYEGKILVSG